ncbi:MAG: elongation factor 4 [Parcubacteria group bacterium RIFCSPHIGHO2_01_FULL_45_26]|nr:MAG: elongation factor 4 [Parcubacteria group bacterium RIFCSPHIGHO2_01_FULL_45_26]
MQNIRNFSIIAHIDHGKSTLADRMLELTGTIEKRKMREQVLDQMDLERERGITIKMQPVHMEWRGHILNLIDTPGHIDFSYEVSRALCAVEGAILLVDATQGVQAQTLSVLNMAREQGLVLLPVVNKIDLPHAETNRTKDEIVRLLGCPRENILAVSSKTGEGVEKLLEEVIARFPPPESLGCPTPKSKAGFLQALVFDFKYDTHKGIILFLRIFAGQVKRLDKLVFAFSKRSFNAIEVGIFKPQELATGALSEGEIGYVVTGIKEPGVARIGDTITSFQHPATSLPGFGKPLPVVWASVYPENQNDFVSLRQALSKLSLSDSALSFEEETSGTLGRGFRCGLLGMLHLEVMTERLRREFNLKLIVASPTITYIVEDIKGKRSNIYSAAFFPDEGSYKEAFEPWANIQIITPARYVGALQALFHEHEVIQSATLVWSGDRVSISAELPLRELMRGFFDELKSLSSGYASLSYKIGELRKAYIARLDLLVNDERVVAFSRVVARRRIEKEAELAADKLEALIPRQMIEVKIQARALGRVIAARRKSALRKDVTDYLYGGDITRKMKLREKQKKGKKKMQARGTVQIPHNVYLKMTKS